MAVRDASRGRIESGRAIDVAEAAIAALDACRADAIRAAVHDLIQKAIFFGRADALLDQLAFGGEMGFEDARGDLIEAKHDLLRLCGIDPTAS